MATKTKTTKTTEATQNKATQREQAFAMWRKKSKNDKYYFTGKSSDSNLVAFYNGMKKNPKEPDLRVYKVDEDGKMTDKVLTSLWCNTSKNGTKYLTGKLNGKRIVGFFYKGENEKAPYFTCYYSEDKPEEKETEPDVSTFEELTDEDIPF